MNIFLNPEDRQRVRRLSEVMDMNNRALGVLGTYLTQCPDFITKELMGSICEECGVSEEDAFVHLLIAACGLEVESNSEDRYLTTVYIKPAIRKLDSHIYQINPYYQQIHIPEVRFANWKLTYESYKPYEAFVCNDILLDGEFKEIPQIGFLDIAFSFPAVMENDIEWMAIKPNEIETMRQPISLASGRVITFGLGMGYYAYMVTEKPEVETLTIVERDKKVIALFREYILPQFPHKEKINLIQEDAFEYVTCRMAGQKYDHAFVDLWHDVSDGYPLYLKMKSLERYAPGTIFSYWIENSLLSHLRWCLFQQVQDNLASGNVAGDKIIFQEIHTYDQLVSYLRIPFLRKLATTVFVDKNNFPLFLS